MVKVVKNILFQSREPIFPVIDFLMEFNFYEEIIKVLLILKSDDQKESILDTIYEILITMDDIGERRKYLWKIDEFAERQLLHELIVDEVFAMEELCEICELEMNDL